MLFLRLDQALEMLEAARSLKERLVIRYAVFNGLAPMEIAAARIEHLDPVECTLYLPRRHHKRGDACPKGSGEEQSCILASILRALREN